MDSPTKPTPDGLALFELDEHGRVIPTEDPEALRRFRECVTMFSKALGTLPPEGSAKVRTKRQKPQIEQEYFSMKQIGEMSGLQPRTIRRLLVDATDPLPSYKIGAAIRISRAEFEAWVGRRNVAERAKRVQQILDEVFGSINLPQTSRKRRKRGTRQT